MSSLATSPRSIPLPGRTIEHKPTESSKREGGNKVAPVDNSQRKKIEGPPIIFAEDGGGILAGPGSDTHRNSIAEGGECVDNAGLSTEKVVPDRLQVFHRNSISEGGQLVVPVVGKIGNAGRFKEPSGGRFDRFLGVIFQSAKLQPRLDETGLPLKSDRRQWKWYLHFVDEDMEQAHDAHIFDVVHPVARNIMLTLIVFGFIINIFWWASFIWNDDEANTTDIIVNMVILGVVEALSWFSVYFFVEKDVELKGIATLDWRTLYTVIILANFVIFGYALVHLNKHVLDDLDRRFNNLSPLITGDVDELNDFMDDQRHETRVCFSDRLLTFQFICFMFSILANVGFLRSMLMAMAFWVGFVVLTISGFGVEKDFQYLARCIFPEIVSSYICLLIINHIDATQRVLFIERHVDHRAREQLRKQNVDLVKRNNLLNYSLESFTRKGAGFNDVKLETPLQTSISILTQLKENLDNPEASAVLDQVMITLRKTEKLNKIDISQKLQESNGDVTSEFKDWLGEHFSTERKQSVLPEKKTGRAVGKNGRISSSRSNSTSSLMGTFGSSFFEERRGSRCDSNILSNIISKKRDNEKIREVLSLWNEWNFNLFELVDLSTTSVDGQITKDNPQPLLLLGMTVFEKYSEIRSMYQIEEKVVHMFLHRVEKTYCFDPDERNEYHTSWHAADVLQTVCCVMQTQIIAVRLSDLDKLTLIVAAIMHDYRHKGVTNKYLIQAMDEIAYDHNDQSVLERFHCQQTFIVLKDPKFNFLINLTEHDFREFRRKLILLILATDLGEGFKYIASFKNAVESEAENENTVKEPLMQMILKLADVSHPCKEWDVHRTWTDMITREFYKQGRAEALLNIPISPLCDETKADIAKSQQGFINFVVNPIVQPLAEYCSNFVWTRQLHENYQRWGTEQMNSKKLDSSRNMGGGSTKEGPS